MAANVASVRVPEKSGLRFECDYTHEHTDPQTDQATGHPAVEYALNRQDFIG